MAIEKGYIDSMCNLGKYYHKIKDYEIMKKYYLMAIEYGDKDSLHYLGNYYHEVGEYEAMKKYYWLSIDIGDSRSMYELGKYYEKIEDYQSMKSYYLMGINRCHFGCIRDLVEHYKVSEQLEEAVYYSLLALEKYKHVGKYDYEVIMDIFNKVLSSNQYEVLKLVELNGVIKNEKQKYQCLVIKKISLAMKEFRFRPNSITTKIPEYNFQLTNNISEETIYQQMKIQTPHILDYLNISDESQVKNKICEYINNY